MESRCKGTNRDGQPCSAHVFAGDELCRWHDPAREADRAAWRRKGGQNRSNRARARKQLADQVMSIGDIDGVLCAALNDVASGEMEPGVGSALATIARTVATIRTAGDIERRLDALEQARGGMSA